MTRSRASLQDRRGFTLIELLVVVAIIGLLAAFAIPALQRAMLRSRVGRMGNDAKTLYKAFVQYNVDVHSYPPESGGDEALDRKTLEPLVRRGYLKEGQSVLATFQGRELSEYRSVDAGSDDDQFYALARLGSLPTVEVVIGDTDQFPGFEGQTIEGAYFVHGGALYALDDDILQKLGK